MSFYIFFLHKRIDYNDIHSTCSILPSPHFHRRWPDNIHNSSCKEWTLKDCCNHMECSLSCRRLYTSKNQHPRNSQSKSHMSSYSFSVGPHSYRTYHHSASHCLCIRYHSTNFRICWICILHKSFHIVSFYTHFDYKANLHRRPVRICNSNLLLHFCIPCHLGVLDYQNLLEWHCSRQIQSKSKLERDQPIRWKFRKMFKVMVYWYTRLRKSPVSYTIC